MYVLYFICQIYGNMFNQPDYWSFEFVPHLLSLLLSHFPFLLDLLLFVNGNIWVSLSVCFSLLGCLLFAAHLMVRPPGFIQLWKSKTK